MLYNSFIHIFYLPPLCLFSKVYVCAHIYVYIKCPRLLKKWRWVQISKLSECVGESRGGTVSRRTGRRWEPLGVWEEPEQQQWRAVSERQGRGRAGSSGERGRSVKAVGRREPRLDRDGAGSQQAWTRAGPPSVWTWREVSGCCRR